MRSPWQLRDLHTAGCTWLNKQRLKLIKGLYFPFRYIYVHLIVGRPRVHLPCDRRISMVTDDVHIFFAEKIKDMVKRLRQCTYKNTWQSSIVNPVGSLQFGMRQHPSLFPVTRLYLCYSTKDPSLTRGEQCICRVKKILHIVENLE